jgi:glutathione S-transferase
MAVPTLIIGNKNYSSWSLRPFMMLFMAGIDFDEKMIPFGEPAFTKKVKKINGAGQVPILLHKDRMIWDTISIIEYIAEIWPKKNIWPKNATARAMARSASAEIHAGFRNLRNACPMNLRRDVMPLKNGFPEAVLNDVKRIETLWAACRKAHGKGGPFLFGKFCAADAMYAPVVSRLHTFAIPVTKSTREYMNAILATEAFQSWYEDSKSETAIVAEDEVD